LHPRFRVKIQAQLFCRLLFHDGVQIADAAVGKYNQVPVAMSIGDFREPRLARPFVRSRGFFPRTEAMQPAPLWSTRISKSEFRNPKISSSWCEVCLTQ
jgi:hypothetical protein